jgi:WD40 repeat protein
MVTGLSIPVACLLLSLLVNPVSSQQNRQEGTREVAWSPEGTLLVTANSNGNIYVYTAQGEIIQTLPSHEGGALAVDWSPDGKQLVSVGFNEVRIWDTATWTTIAAPAVGTV